MCIDSGKLRILIWVESFVYSLCLQIGKVAYINELSLYSLPTYTPTMYLSFHQVICGPKWVLSSEYEHNSLYICYLG